MDNKVKQSGEKLTGVAFNVTVKSGLSLIPIVGPSLANAYDEINNKIQFERLESFIIELQEEIKSLKENSHNQDLSKEEYGVIVEKIFKSVKTEPDSVKRNYFKRLFINGLIINNVQSYRIEIFTKILSELNIVDFKMLKLLHEKDSSIQIQTIDDPDFSKEETYGSINKLKSYGFVDVNVSSMTLAGPQSRVKEQVQLNWYGKMFMDYCLK